MHYEQLQALSEELNSICETHEIFMPAQESTCLEKFHHLRTTHYLNEIKSMVERYKDFHAPESEVNRLCRHEFRVAVDWAHTAEDKICRVQRKITKLFSIEAAQVKLTQLNRLQGISEALQRLRKEDEAHISTMSPIQRLTKSDISATPVPL